MKLNIMPPEKFANDPAMPATLKDGSVNDDGEPHHPVNLRLQGQGAAFGIGPIHRKGGIHFLYFVYTAPARHTMRNTPCTAYPRHTIATPQQSALQTPGFPDRVVQKQAHLHANYGIKTSLDIFGDHFFFPFPRTFPRTPVVPPLPPWCAQNNTVFVVHMPTFLNTPLSIVA